MADLDLPQSEADTLIAMEKHRIDEKVWDFPGPGEKKVIPLTSMDKRESFILDITRATVKLTKITYQNRARVSIILIRLDIDGPIHRNPDGEEIACPHVHIYREGSGTKWAFPLSREQYPDIQTFGATLTSFMEHCNITEPPAMNMELF